MKTSLKQFLCAAFLVVALTGPAFASSSVQTQANVGISANDRTTLTNYVRELPSGVRSTNSSATQYRVGETLPASVQTSSLPANVTNSITSTPSGYSYVQAGSDVYLISNANRRIVDRVGIR